MPRFFSESGYKKMPMEKLLQRELLLLIGLFPKNVYAVAAKSDAKDDGKFKPYIS
jgi:hypothetical protein